MIKKIFAREFLYLTALFSIVLLLLAFYYGSIQVREYYNDQYEKEDVALVQEIEKKEESYRSSNSTSEINKAKQVIEGVEEERVILRRSYSTFVGPKLKYEHYHWNIVFWGTIVSFSILFPLRYFIWGVKWSLSTLREK